MRKDLDHHWGGHSKRRREAHGPHAMTFFKLYESAEPLRLPGCMAHTVTPTDWKWTLCREHASDHLFFQGLFHLRDSTNTYSSRCDHISLNCCDTVSRKCLLWVQDGKAAAVFLSRKLHQAKCCSLLSAVRVQSRKQSFPQKETLHL